MEKDELARYFEDQKLLYAMYTRTFIDYDDIETPVKTVYRGSNPITLSSNMKIEARYTMNTNEFRDMPHIPQLFSDVVTSQFVNLENVEFDKSEMAANDDYFFKGRIMMGESKEIKIRRVIGVMQFLGEVGGIYSSIFIIGATLNFCFTGNN